MWMASADTTTATYLASLNNKSQPNCEDRLNMKQNTAYGASLITSPIRVMEISNRPCTPSRSVSTALDLVSTMPTPIIRAKNITARMASSAAAWTTLLGTIDTSIWMPLGASVLPLTMLCARSAFSAINCCACAGSMPAPGWNRLTISRPRITARPDITMVRPSVRQPTRPNERMSPISLTPITSAENSSGITSMKIRRRKISPAGPVITSVNSLSSDSQRQPAAPASQAWPLSWAQLTLPMPAA